MTPIEFDSAPYLTTPRAQVRGYLATSRLLVHYKPDPATPEVELAAKRLQASVAEYSQALVDRHLAETTRNPEEDTDFDLCVDGLFFVTRDRLDNWKVFERAGFATLAARQEADSFDYAARIDKAKRARSVLRKLLGRSGLEFTRRPAMEQVEHMITFWTVVEQEKLIEDLTKLVGEDFVLALRDCQGHYEQMVAAQAAGGKGRVNLNEVRVQLQRKIIRYSTTVLAMVDDEDEASVAMVRAALSPIDMLRRHVARTNRGPSGEVEVEDEIEEIEIDIDPLLAEQAALDKELGLVIDEDDDPDA